MHVHEFQAKDVLKKFNIPVPEYDVAANSNEVDAIIKKRGLQSAVIKIQVHAGGRGKAGGVKFAKTPEEIRSVAKSLIGMKMVNNQTGPAGVTAHQVLIAPPVDIEKEYYLGAVINRESKAPILIASPEGGMDIEEIAEKTPEKILMLPIELDGSVRPYNILRLLNFMGWRGDLAKQGKVMVQGLAKAFIEKDAELLEINPLILSKENTLLALDAKLSVDDNALFRQPDISNYFDPTQQSASEVTAREHDLAYIALDGTIGCMVNGAGLAMATMDIIQLCGGAPANFLDVGGGASREKISEGFRIILSDKSVKAILVNIFGGIMDCSLLAEGIVHAAKETQINVPLVVRMEGNNSDQGRKLLQSSGLAIFAVNDFAEAAKTVVAKAK